MSRLDMNTCQTSIKTETYYSVADDSPWYYRQYENTTVVPSELN